MSDIIRLLPDAIANQIAAGEVVQRPASIVKELIENAIDAGATFITLTIKEAGKSLIRVNDNGKGMSNTDARLCFERHATSKISKADDLFAIRTMGFRGEAMASIAAVAQVELVTRSADAALGTLVRIEGSQLKAHEPATKAEVGTMISVKNLFFNVPARRNFLKSNPQEMRHILEEVQRCALARPDIGFAVYQADLETMLLAATPKLSTRILDLLGFSYEKNLIPCKIEIPIIELSGYIGTPAVAKKTRGDQYFFVNKRYIKSPYLHHAVVTAFEGLLPSDMFPFYVLHIQIDPAMIDINVHPTKTEIKFEDERGIYSLLQAAVRQSLQDYNITPSIDFELDINNDPVFGIQQPAYTLSGGGSGGAIRPIGTDFSVSPEQQRLARNVNNWQSLYGSPNQIPRNNNGDFSEAISLESTLNRREPNGQDLVKEQLANQNRHAFRLQSGYLVAPVKTGLMLIDLVSALERIHYERMYKLYTPAGKLPAYTLIFPKTIGLNPADYSLVIAMKDSLENLGIELEDFGQNNILVRSLPAGFEDTNEKELIDSILEQIKESGAAAAQLPTAEIALRSLAGRAGLQSSKKIISGPEIESLIAELFASSMPHLSPKGKKIIVVLDLERIQGFFE